MPESKKCLSVIVICDGEMVTEAILHNNEGKNNMITQAIKRWFYKLFAWWPWKHSPETNYPQAVSNLNMTTVQETMVRAVDGPVPQPGATSVAIGQEREQDSSENLHPSTDEDLIQQAEAGEQESLLAKKTQLLKESDSQEKPSQEQMLTFLKYLVQKGQVNEGFDEGQAPDQYRKQ